MSSLPALYRNNFERSWKWSGIGKGKGEGDGKEFMYDIVNGRVEVIVLVEGMAWMM